MKRLATQLPADTVILLTADHGMVDVAEQWRIDYSAEPELTAGVRHTAGEPRMVHLYLEPDADVAHRGTAGGLPGCTRYGNKAWVLTREQAVRAGFFGAGAPGSAAPDRRRADRRAGARRLLRRPPGPPRRPDRGGPARFADPGGAGGPAAAHSDAARRHCAEGTAWLNSSSFPAPWTAASPRSPCRWTTTTAPAAAAACSSAATTAPANLSSPAAWACSPVPWR